MSGTEAMRMELRRAQVHLSLLEKDQTHPIDLMIEGAPTSPAFILRAGQRLRSAHSDVCVSYEVMREMLIEALRARVAELDEQVIGTEPHLSLDELQYGDQTEA